MNNKIETLENAIRHINTAIDVDPWAKQTAVEAMRYMIASLVSKPKRMYNMIQPAQPKRIGGRWMAVQHGDDDEFIFARCIVCKWDSGEAFELAQRRFKFCPNCGADMRGGKDE